MDVVTTGWPSWRHRSAGRSSTARVAVGPANRLSLVAPTRSRRWPRSARVPGYRAATGWTASLVGWRRHDDAAGAAFDRRARRARGRDRNGGRPNGRPGHPRATGPIAAVPGHRRAEDAPGQGVRAGRAADGGDRLGDPGGPAVVRVPGGLPIPAVGGALGADLPSGEPGDRDALGAAPRSPRVHGVCQLGARRADPGRRAGDRAAAAAGTCHRRPGPGLDHPGRPDLRGGHAPGCQGRERGLPRAVRDAHAGGRSGSAGEHGGGLPDGRRLQPAGGSRALGHLPQAAGTGLDRAPGRARRDRAGGDRRPRPARAGPGDVLPGPGGLHPADRGARRPGRRRVGRVPGRAGRPVLA